jgi:hypothetical protein
MPRLCRFILVEETHVTGGWLAGSQGLFGRVRKISSLTGFDSRIVHTVAYSYTECLNNNNNNYRKQPFWVLRAYFSK